MPEAPQMQALAERLAAWLASATFTGYEPLGFTGLKTYDPPPEALVGRELLGVGRQAKYLILDFGDDLRMLVHLSQAGRMDFENPPKKTKPKGSVVRLKFSDDRAVLVREHGTERKAGWWVLGPGEVGPLEKLGPEATSDEFAEWVRPRPTGAACTRSCATSGRSPASDTATPTTSCTAPSCRPTRRSSR